MESAKFLAALFGGSRLAFWFLCQKLPEIILESVLRCVCVAHFSQVHKICTKELKLKHEQFFTCNKAAEL